VVHGETGLTADPDDHQGLADHVVALCRDDIMHEKLARNGRQRAIDHFLWDRQVDRYLKCYEQCLNDQKISA